MGTGVLSALSALATQTRVIPAAQLDRPKCQGVADHVLPLMPYLMLLSLIWPVQLRPALLLAMLLKSG